MRDGEEEQQQQETRCRSTDKEDSELSVTGPGGMGFRARGTDLIAIITMVAVCMMAYALFDHQASAKDASLKTAEAMNKLQESQQELNYLMTLTPEQRSHLSLEMPESLRRRMR